MIFKDLPAIHPEDLKPGCVDSLDARLKDEFSLAKLSIPQPAMATEKTQQLVLILTRAIQLYIHDSNIPGAAKALEQFTEDVIDCLENVLKGNYVCVKELQQKLDMFAGKLNIKTVNVEEVAVTDVVVSQTDALDQKLNNLGTEQKSTIKKAVDVCATLLLETKTLLSKKYKPLMLAVFGIMTTVYEPMEAVTDLATTYTLATGIAASNETFHNYGIAGTLPSVDYALNNPWTASSKLVIMDRIQKKTWQALGVQAPSWFNKYVPGMGFVKTTAVGTAAARFTWQASPPALKAAISMASSAYNLHMSIARDPERMQVGRTGYDLQKLLTIAVADFTSLPPGVRLWYGIFHITTHVTIHSTHADPVLDALINVFVSEKGRTPEQMNLMRMEIRKYVDVALDTPSSAFALGNAYAMAGGSKLAVSAKDKMIKSFQFVFELLHQMYSNTPALPGGASVGGAPKFHPRDIRYMIQALQESKVMRDWIPEIAAGLSGNAKTLFMTLAQTKGMA